MPIVNLPANPPKIPTKEAQPVQLTEPSYKHSIVDTKQCPVSSLLTHIEGSSWYVDYYSQVLGASEELSDFQPAQVNPYQQYHLIKRYEFKLQDSLNQSVDSESNIFTVTGSAQIYPFLTPNTGDAFIADIGDGRAGQFSITSVTAKSIFKETTYEIEFVLARVVDQTLIDNINNRVVKTSYYVRDYLTYGQNPIISSDALEAKNTLNSLATELTNAWMSFFFSREFSTFLVPGQVFPTYDPYIVNMVYKLFDIDVHNNLRVGQILNVDGLHAANQKSIWTALLLMSSDELYDIFKEPQLIPVSYFNDHANFRGIRFTGIRDVVVAVDLQDTVDRDYAVEYSVTGNPYNPLNDAPVDLGSVLYYNGLNEFLYPDEAVTAPDSIYVLDEIPVIHPIANHGGYVLSKHYYDKNVNGYSKLEHLVTEFLTNQDVNRNVLYGLCRAAKEWGRLEKFYYIPILLIMLKAVQRKV